MAMNAVITITPETTYAQLRKIPSVYAMLAEAAHSDQYLINKL